MDMDFIKRANAICNEYLLKTEKYYEMNRNRWFSDFVGHFRNVCFQVCKLQGEGNLTAMSYIEYTMLYTNIIRRQYVADIFVYGGRSYLDKEQHFVGSYDISFLFFYYNMLWEDLLYLRKRYAGRVTAREIVAFMLQGIPDFYSYLAPIARFSIAKSVEGIEYMEGSGMNSLANIDKNEVFMVNVGGYMSTVETVYQEVKNKNADRLAKWFGERFCDTYFFGDYCYLEFEGKSFMNTDFRFAQFCSSTLNNTNLKGSSLIGANFRGAVMEGCCLDYCSIHEADFSYAILKNANIRDAHAKTGLIDEKVWKFPGFLPARFCNADLTGADFSGSILIGASFVGAILTGTKFTATNLTGADFTGATIRDTDFSGATLDGASFVNTAVDNAIVGEDSSMCNS